MDETLSIYENRIEALADDIFNHVFNGVTVGRAKYALKLAELCGEIAPSWVYALANGNVSMYDDVLEVVKMLFTSWEDGDEVVSMENIG